MATTTRQLRDTPVDVKLVLCSLWIAMLFVFTWAYYFIGSLVEVVLLAAIARTAWQWPPPQIAPPAAQAVNVRPEESRTEE